MLKKILGALGMGPAPSGGAEPPPAAPPASGSRAMRIRPYRDEHCDFIYNLLFCDDLALFEGPDPGPWLAVLRDPGAGAAALRAIADDDANYDSRIRTLAFNRLREMGEPVPAKVLLGTIVEVGMEAGLDTLAAFEDEGVRYINHTGKMSIYEGSGHPLAPQVQALLAASRAVVAEIGPWTEERLPPPPNGEVRMTFLVSDGLYFGQGPFGALMEDPMGGPVIAASLALLNAIVDQQPSA